MPSSDIPSAALRPGHDLAMMASDGDMAPVHEALLRWDHIPVLSSTWWQALVAVVAIALPGVQTGGK